MDEATATERRTGGCCSGLPGGATGLWVVGLLVLALDQATKSVVAESLPHGGSTVVVEGFFSLVHFRNTGMAFSLFADAAPWFKSLVIPLVQVGVIVAVVAMFRSAGRDERFTRFALALVLGGAAGNLTDRVLRGYVTDFLDFYLGSYHWPAFNVADSAITVGACLLLLVSVAGRGSTREAVGAA